VGALMWPRPCRSNAGSRRCPRPGRRCPTSPRDRDLSGRVITSSTGFRSSGTPGR
jgi:hypothetical protein